MECWEMRSIIVRLLVCLIAFSSLTGIARPVTAQQPKDPMAAEVEEPVQVNVYFVRNGKLALVHRVIAMPEGKRIARATMQLLMDGPTEQELAFGVTSAIPFLANVEDVQLESATGIATVTLTREFNDSVWGGSAGLRFAQIVYTLTQFPTIERVRVQAETSARYGGEDDPEVVAGLGVLYDRTDLDGTLGGAFFDGPAIGDVISSPLRLTGYANVFEGQFQVHLTDLAGTEIGAQWLSASWGETHGTFDAELAFDPALAGTETVVLTVHAVSGYAGDRNMPDLVNVPLWLAD
jgi:germination protein M